MAARLWLQDAQCPLPDQVFCAINKTCNHSTVSMHPIISLQRKRFVTLGDLLVWRLQQDTVVSCTSDIGLGQNHDDLESDEKLLLEEPELL